jgi:hypothetical protein
VKEREFMIQIIDYEGVSNQTLYLESFMNLYLIKIEAYIFKDYDETPSSSDNSLFSHHSLSQNIIFS